MTGPPMYLNLDFIASSLVGTVGGVASAVVLAGFTWWAPIVLVLAWASTHWLLRESGVWKDRNTPEVRSAQRHADYAYRLAVDPQPAKELRLFGLAGWTVARFIERRNLLFELQYRATRLREKSVVLVHDLRDRRECRRLRCSRRSRSTGGLLLDRLVVYAQVALGVSLIAFGGLNWALDGAAAPVAAVGRLGPAMAPLGSLAVGSSRRPIFRTTRSRSVTSHSAIRAPTGPVFAGLNLTVPAGTSLAIVGQNGAGKTTLAKLLCRLYDPTAGSIKVDGVDLRDIELAGWRARLAAVFQDFVRFELSLRENVDPAGQASDDDIRTAFADAGALHLADLDTPLAKGYAGGTDLSGGQWQRVALARALCAVRRGAGLVLLDEPTAQLDVRGEAEVFDKVLQRPASHDDLDLAPVFHRPACGPDLRARTRSSDRAGQPPGADGPGGRYRTMFELQAKRFEATVDDEGVVFDVL